MPQPLVGVASIALPGADAVCTTEEINAVDTGKVGWQRVRSNDRATRIASLRATVLALELMTLIKLPSLRMARLLFGRIVIEGSSSLLVARE